MGLSPGERDPGTAEHGACDGDDGRPGRARELAGAVAAIKRELAAILVVAAVGTPIVMVWLDGARELVVLGGYGAGAVLWIHARVRGLTLAARRPRDGGDGP